MLDLNPPPSTLLILGSGVFALSSLHQILQRPSWSRTKVTIVSPSFPGPVPHTSDSASPSTTHTNNPASAITNTNTWPTTATQTSSIDTSRIIRADYSKSKYVALGHRAQELWREGGWGDKSRYNEVGLFLTADRLTTDEGESDGNAAYVLEAYENNKSRPGVEKFEGREEVADVLKTCGGRGTGSVGYLNRGSGWADAGGAMAWLLERVLELNAARDESAKVRFVVDRAVRLLSSTGNPGEKNITGAELGSGETVNAQKTFLATGAWTPSLIDLRGVASARGQTVGYMDITNAEARALKDMPVHLNLSHGCFVFPPTRVGGVSAGRDAGWEVKVAKHAFGYSNPTVVASMVDVDREVEGDEVAVSLPSFPDAMPKADEEIMLSFLAEALPVLELREKPGRRLRPRLCWYLDTLSGEYLVCHHPAFGDSLMLATGGSGHAYKFLPIMGEHVVDVMEGIDDSAAWGVQGWPRRQLDDDGKVKDEVWCQDGSRSGRRITLKEALN